VDTEEIEEIPLVDVDLLLVVLVLVLAVVVLAERALERAENPRL
jgi:biopolymer transport protein ExbD